VDFVKHTSLMTLTGATGSSTGTTLGGLSRYNSFVFTMNMTTGTGTYGMALDTKIGTAWVNVLRTTDLTTGSLLSYPLAVRNNLTAAEVNASVDAGAGTVRAIPIHDQVRVRLIETTATLMTGVATLYAVK
jgi:hypothetical protein